MRSSPHNLLVPYSRALAVLSLTISEAVAFFGDVESIRKRLHALEEVGLGYGPVASNPVLAVARLLQLLAAGTCNWGST